MISNNKSNYTGDFFNTDIISNGDNINKNVRYIINDNNEFIMQDGERM